MLHPYNPPMLDPDTTRALCIRALASHSLRKVAKECDISHECLRKFAFSSGKTQLMTTVEKIQIGLKKLGYEQL